MENKKHSLFNVFDLVLIGIALVLAAILVIARFAGPRDTAQPDGPAGIESGKVTYTVEFTLDEAERDTIRVGDRVTDKVKHYNLGTVSAVEIAEATRSVPDLEAEKVVSAVIPGMIAMRVTVTANATVSNKGTMVDGGYPLYLGVSVNAVFPGINAVGSVIAIERGQAQ